MSDTALPLSLAPLGLEQRAFWTRRPFVLDLLLSLLLFFVLTEEVVDWVLASEARRNLAHEAARWTSASSSPTDDHQHHEQHDRHHPDHPPALHFSHPTPPSPPPPPPNPRTSPPLAAHASVFNYGATQQQQQQQQQQQPTAAQWFFSSATHDTFAYLVHMP